MSKIKLFESKQVRTQWDADKQKWFFAVIDVVEILTGSDRPRKYWSDLMPGNWPDPKSSFQVGKQFVCTEPVLRI